jgi:succinate dehydrogenase / fumarate reductase, flavoprotein subunit
MTEYCGVFRSEDLMKQGLEQLQSLRQQAQQVYLDDKGTTFNTELLEALELQSLMLVGEIILTGALNRQESRGAHSREDFPARDDANFLKHTLAYYSPAGIEIRYMPVVVNRFEPQERKY